MLNAQIKLTNEHKIRDKDLTFLSVRSIRISHRYDHLINTNGNNELGSIYSRYNYVTYGRNDRAET